MGKFCSVFRQVYRRFLHLTHIFARNVVNSCTFAVFAAPTLALFQLNMKPSEQTFLACFCGRACTFVAMGIALKYA